MSLLLPRDYSQLIIENPKAQAMEAGISLSLYQLANSQLNHFLERILLQQIIFTASDVSNNLIILALRLRLIPHILQIYSIIIIYA